MAEKLAVFTTNLGCGGAERVLSILINYWSERSKYDIVLFTTFKGESFYKLHENIKIHILASKPTSNKINVFLNIKSCISELKSELIKNEIPTIICFGRFTSCIGSIISKKININAIICERSSPFYNTNFIWRQLPKLYYKYATSIVLQTKASQPHFEKLFKLPKTIKIIANPISDTFLKGPKKTNRDKIILCVGRLHPVKGHKELINALSYITDWKEWKVIIVGDGVERINLERQILAMGLDEKVNLVGKSDDVASYYENARIFVLPSTTEGYPNALIEACVKGCACISFDCNFGPNEIITQKINGILVPLYKNKQLGNAIQSLMSDETLLKKLADGAWNSRLRFELSEIILQWEELINLKRT